MATGLEKVSFHSNPKEKQYQRKLKLLQIALISHESKVMVKNLQSRLQQYIQVKVASLPYLKSLYSKYLLLKFSWSKT